MLLLIAYKIYKIMRIDSERVYVGQTRLSVEIRWAQHRGNARKELHQQLEQEALKDGSYELPTE